MLRLCPALDFKRYTSKNLYLKTTAKYVDTTSSFGVAQGSLRTTDQGYVGNSYSKSSMDSAGNF